MGAVYWLYNKSPRIKFLYQLLENKIDRLMNKILAFAFIDLSSLAFSQIKEEKLILKRKREPEVKRIEKKKAAAPLEKNYPPKEKKVEDSLNLKYDIIDVPSVSDFQTSTIQRADINPKLSRESQNNYFRIGFGNYGKVLADGNISKMLDNKIELGGDIHYLSTSGLKKQYDWDSGQYNADLAAFAKHYGEKGKASAVVEYSRNSYNFYGIYNNDFAVGKDLSQATNHLKVNAYYDYYSNEILNDVRVKSSFLSDKFKANESAVEMIANLSKHHLDLSSDIRLNADLGLNLLYQNTDFEVGSQHNSSFLNFEFNPKLSFFKGESHLRLGSGFSFLSSKNSSLAITEPEKFSKIYWFPEVEFLLAVGSPFKFYGGVDGGLKINSYSSLLSENPYLLPDQELKPTQTKYRFYFGLKGDISEAFKYDVSAGFSKLRNIAFFKANGFPDSRSPEQPYEFSNTFSALYDNGSQSFVKGSIHYFPIANVVIDGELSFQKYTLDNHEYIYNMPLVKAELGVASSLLSRKLQLGVKGFFVTDRTSNSFSLAPSALPYPVLEEDKDTKVGGYADINLSAEYKLHKNFSIFALANNLLNANYQTYKGYKVLGTQILGGLKISF